MPRRTHAGAVVGPLGGPPARSGLVGRDGGPVPPRVAGAVVAVVGARPSLDAAVGIDPHLVALPVVPVLAGGPEHRRRSRGRGVAVVGPVLDVDTAGPLAAAVVAL